MPKKEKELSMSELRMGRKLVERLISEAAEAYCMGIDQVIWKFLEELEEEVKQDNETTAKMDDWRNLVLDPGNTRVRITQFN